MSTPLGLYPDQGNRPTQETARGRKSIKCLNCQARRAKCSSDRPACIQCLNRGEVCCYNGETAVENDQLRGLRSRVAQLSDKDKAKYQKRKAKVVAGDSEEDGPSLRKVRSTPTLGQDTGLVPPVPPLPYWTRSASKSPTMEQMIPGVVYNLAEAQHNARRSTPNLRHSIAADSYNPNLPSTPIMANASLHSPVPRRASTAPQAFSFVNYTEDDAEELMEAVAPSGGRGGGGTPQKSRQRKPSVLSSDDEFNPTPKARARHQSIPARKSSLKTVKSVGNLARPPSRLLSPISTDVAQASFAPNQTPMSAMAAATYSAPLVEPAPRTLRRYASANFSPSLSSVADVPDQLIDPQLRIGGIPDFGSNAQAPVPAWDGPSAGATVPPMCSTPLTPAPAQAFTFMRPGSPSLYVRIPQAAPHVSVTVSSESVAAPPAASPSMPPPNGFPPLPPLPTPRWAGALPSPDPSVPSPAAPTLHLDDVVKQGVTTDPYLLVTAPVRSPSPAFAWGAQSNRKVSDPLGELALNWHASLPPVAPSPINSAPPTPFLSVPGMSGYFMWVPEPGQPTGVLPIPAGVEQAAAVQDGQPPE